ncbi:hypothetical protein [Actinoplanes sp. GCM10030250]|uniref:hypothetical protein n=1 Tax=Actinoplanes sp. GCM10030250 TaxID=3273376 RepID=UPI0036094650
MTGDTPARQVNVAHDNATVLAVQDGDLHVHQRIGTHLIEELSFGEAPPLLDEQPSRLLNADNRVVSFTGREREIAELTAWRDTPTSAAVRLVHGGAGQGKTRLAYRFAELSQASGWIALHARHSRDAVRPVEVSGGSDVVPSGRILVLVDYAERWPLSDLLALLLDGRLHRSAGLRVLLLARPVGNWWHALTYRLSQSLGAHADSVELAPLGETQVGYREAFEVARSCFARVLGVTDPGHPAPEAEGSVLTIHMAALAYVLAVRHGDVPPTDPGHLSAYLLSRERNHWQAMYDNERRIESPPQVLGRAVFVAALTRPLDHAAAVLTLRSAAVADSVEAAARVLDDHAMCYPAHNPETQLEPLYPDRLAEDFVALQTPGHALPGFRPDPWATGALPALAGGGPGTAGTALPLLVEAARRWPHLAEKHLLPLLAAHPELAVQAGAVALSVLAAAPMIPLDVLAAIEASLPNDPPQDLYAGIAAITERLARDTTDPARAARLLRKLGWRLLDSGRVADGLATLTAAVDTARRLAAGNHTAHVAQLESALRAAGRAHARVGDWKKAAAALGQAVACWNDPAGRAVPGPEDIASCLADLSLALWHIGDNAWSLTVRDQALQQLRRLVSTDPRHRRTLARTLVQQAEQLRRGERRDDSLDALDEATDLLRAVAGGVGSGIESDIATALLARAKTLQSLGRLAEAEHAASGAVRFYRQLAGLNVAFDQDLAQALEAEADILAARNRWAGAIEAQANATAIHRRLIRINAERYGLDLVHTLIRFARLCRDAGRKHREGLETLAEAMRLLHSGQWDAATQQRLLAVAQSLGADLLEASGRREDADTLRRPRPARQPPSPTATPQRTRPSSQRPVSTAEDRARGRSMADLPPYTARRLLEELEPRSVAATLVTMNPRHDWLEMMFRGFHSDDALRILRRLVQFDELVKNPVVLQRTAKLLLGCSSQFVAGVLGQAAPLTAATILSFDEWTIEARRVLRLMDPAESDPIVRLLAYDPERPFGQ